MGIEGADAACQKDADVWFQGRTFRAWISTSTESALARVGQGPWFVGSERLGTAADLAANQLGTPFNRSATGSVFATGEYAWTGTVSGGTAASVTCADWTSKDVGLTGLVGQINYAGEEWTVATIATTMAIFTAWSSSRFGQPSCIRRLADGRNSPSVCADIPHLRVSSCGAPNIVEVFAAENHHILEFHGCKCNTRRIVRFSGCRGDLLCAAVVRRPSCPGA